MSIKVVHFALDDVDGDIILRGVVDPQSLPDLLVAEYQREQQPQAKIDDLVEAYKIGSVPDIVLGMRGGRVRDLSESTGAMLLLDDVYIIDGYQRVSAGRKMLALHASGEIDVLPRVGAAIHFDTTEAWERAQFRILNVNRTKVAPSVILRNMRHDEPAVNVLWQLTRERGFVMHGRVCWEQRKTREELLTALVFAKIIAKLHSHLGPGKGTNVDSVANGLQKIMDRVGKTTFKNNIRTFYDLVDQCWGVQRVAYKEGAVYMRATFLEVLAMILSDHLDFWKEDKLMIMAPEIRKIRAFPIKDPQIDSLSSSSGKAAEMLYILLLAEINKGRRTRRLHPRKERSFLGNLDLEDLTHTDPDQNGHDDEEDEGES